jgi:hypothetical protein
MIVRRARLDGSWALIARGPMLRFEPMPDRSETIVYCLTRDRELALALEERLTDSLAFFYNDAARLSQAVVLRLPDLVVIDTGAIREEYGDSGLGPVIAFLRERAPDARLTVRPASGVEHLVAAEAGPEVEMLAAGRSACVDGVAAACGAL